MVAAVRAVVTAAARAVVKAVARVVVLEGRDMLGTPPYMLGTPHTCLVLPNTCLVPGLRRHRGFGVDGGVGGGGGIAAAAERAVVIPRASHVLERASERAPRCVCVRCAVSGACVRASDSVRACVSGCVSVRVSVRALRWVCIAEMNE